MTLKTKAQRQRSEAKKAKAKVPPPVFGDHYIVHMAPLGDRVTIGVDKAQCCDCPWFSLSDRTLGGWDRLHFRAEGHALLDGHAVSLFRSWQELGDDPCEVVVEVKLT